MVIKHTCFSHQGEQLMYQKGVLSKIQNAKYLRLFFGSNILLLINDHQFFIQKGKKEY